MFAAVELGWWWWYGVLCTMHIHFRVKPNYSVEVVLWFCCVVVGVVTSNTKIKRGDITNKPRKKAGSCQILLQKITEPRRTII